MLKKVITNLLLAFVIFSIGFAAGKEIALSQNTGTNNPIIDVDEKVIVYYLRSTFRCWQCNLIEIYTDELVVTEFKEYLDSGLLEWRVEDYLQNRDLGNRYNISGNTVIVVRYEDGEEVSHIRLDQVMEKVFNQPEFFSYVRDAITKQMSNHLKISSLETDKELKNRLSYQSRFAAEQRGYL